MPEGLRVLEAAASRHGLDFEFETFDFASCDYYAVHGGMMPEAWKARSGGHDAILFGAVGWPETVPDHISLWGSQRRTGARNSRMDGTSCSATP